ncbi:MAG TPA: L-threonylcarbamoyladenylate synthase [Egibacteraceae bacterium]|nr:L-threonylcarbamoyladenylate synthase [Egibacteraceae bacterium]
MEVLRVDRDRPDPEAIAAAADALRAGGLVAFPTETVYGLGADARREDAVRALFAAKGRPADNPLIVHVADADGLPAVAASVPPLAARLAERFWPGPLTLVVDAGPAVPAVTTGGLATVAVRVPHHPVALALLLAAGLPVAAPSANRSGRPSPTTAAHVLHDLGDARVDLVLDAGPAAIGIESTVVDARGDQPVILREGAITREALGGAASAPGSSASPGTRHRHYAPSCPVEIVPAGEGVRRARALTRAGRRVGLVGAEDAGDGVATLAVVDGAAALARTLYEALRAAEAAAVDVVVVEAVPEAGIGRAVMDRLRRAAAG